MVLKIYLQKDIPLDEDFKKLESLKILFTSSEIAILHGSQELGIPENNSELGEKKWNLHFRKLLQ